MNAEFLFRLVFCQTYIICACTLVALRETLCLVNSVRLQPCFSHLGMIDFYAELEVQAGADLSAVKKSYRQLVQTSFPCILTGTSCGPLLLMALGNASQIRNALKPEYDMKML